MITAPPAPASIIFILASSGRIDWKLPNKKDFNVLQLAVKMENLK